MPLRGGSRVSRNEERSRSESPVKKRVSRRASAEAVFAKSKEVDSDGGYSSDGGLAKKKNELRASKHGAAGRLASPIKHRPRASSAEKTRVVKKKPVGGSEHGTTSSGSGMARKKSPAPRKPSGDLDGSQHSVGRVRRVPSAQRTDASQYRKTMGSPTASTSSRKTPGVKKAPNTDGLRKTVSSPTASTTKKRPANVRKTSSLDGSQHSLKSPPTTMRKRPSDVKKASSGLDGSQHSVRSTGGRRITYVKTLDPSQGSKEPVVDRERRSSKKSSDLDGSAHSARSMGSSAGRRRASIVKTMDGSQHSAASAKRRGSKKSSEMDGSGHSTRQRRSSRRSSDMDGSSHSTGSTASTRSRKSGREQEQEGKPRRGRRQSNLDNSSFHSDGQSSDSSSGNQNRSTREQRSSISGRQSAKKPAPRRKTMPGEELECDENGSPVVKKRSWGESLSEEMRTMLDDDAAFGPQQGDKDKVPVSPRRTTSFRPNGKKPTESDKSSTNAGDKKASTSASEQTKEAKDMEAILYKQLAESEGRERKLAEEAKADKKARDELLLQVQTMELMLKEEQQKNLELRGKLITSQKENPDSAFDRAVTDALRREVEALTEENELLQAQLHENGASAAKQVADGQFSNIDDMTKGQLRSALTQSKSKLEDSEARVSSQDIELKALREKLQRSYGAQHRADSESVQEMIDSLKKAKETMKESIRLERIEMESKLKNKDETIQFLQAELGKMKVSRGGASDGDMPQKDGASMASRFGSVFTRPPTYSKNGIDSVSPSFVTPTFVSGFQ